jgi:hypothetical protein
MMFFLLAPLAPFDIEMASASPSGKFGLAPHPNRQFLWGKSQSFGALNN